MSQPNHIPLINAKVGSGDWVKVPAGKYGFGYECSNWNSINAKLQWSRNGVDAQAQDVDGTQYTADVVVNGIELMDGYVKAVLSGTPTGTFYAYIGSVA